jgi:hypothetical protein
VTAEDDNDAGAAFDRAAAHAARREEAGNTKGFRWINEHRYRAAVGRLVLVVVLLAAHVVAVQAVTVWLIAHLVLIAILASQVAKRWLARGDTGPLPS